MGHFNIDEIFIGETFGMSSSMTITFAKDLKISFLHIWTERVMVLKEAYTQFFLSFLKLAFLTSSDSLVI